MTAADFYIILPELILALYAMAALVFVVYRGKDKTAPRLVWLTSGVLLALALLIGLGGFGAQVGFGGLFVDDAFARFVKVTILISAAAVMLMSQDYMTRRNMLCFEFPILISFAVIGMMVMVSAANLMTLYMGLELQSLSLYVVAAMRRDSAKSSEAGLKYFVLGALSSGIFLYGASLAYGYAGTADFAGIMAALGDDVLPTGLLIGLVFMFAALAFKISAVPFHMWTPDVYEGAPTPVTAFFASAPKVAAMALIARLAFDAFGEATSDWTQILAVLAVLSMFFGAIAAIGQRDLKRLMAYSSIAHMGYALVGLASGTIEGVQATLIYMAIYVTMNIGTFAFILSMERDGRPVSDVASLNMLSKSQPMNAFVLLVLMFSLAGVPPTLGFFGKFYVLNAAVNAHMTWLAVAGALASVIGAFYYIRIVYFMYFGAEKEPLSSVVSPVQWALMVGSAAVMLVGVINLFGLESVAQNAAIALVR